jgi:predicted TIM-barrel fold metal-dependent hydrolase
MSITQETSTSLADATPTGGRVTDDEVGAAATDYSQFDGVEIFDADQHMYETRDAVLKFLPDEFRGAVQFVDIEGRTKISILGKTTDYIPNPTFDVVAAPGAHELFYSGTNTEGKTLRELSGKPIRSIPAFRTPEARVEMLDKFGVAQTLNYPTLANLVEASAAANPDLVHAIIHGLNQWMLETWSFNYQDRVYSTPVISMPDLDKALAELEWAAENGAKCVLIKPAPVHSWQGWRSPALPHYDPFWARVQELDMPVVFHGSQPPLMDYVDMWETADTNSAFSQSAFKYIALGHREISDMMASLICHGTLTRFPHLRIASVENGSSWLEPLLNDLDALYHKMPNAFDEHPVEVFRRNIWVSPFWEGSVSDVMSTVGGDKVLFGSDYPHPEGLAEPRGYFKYSQGLKKDDTVRFMGDNTRTFLGFDTIGSPPAGHG